MTIALPASPAPRSATPRPVTRRRDATPIFNGPESRTQFLGDRWALDVELPPMTYTQAMAWVSALTRGGSERVSLPFPQPGFDTGAPGTTLVKGAGQLGQALIVDGFNAYTVKDGQFFNVITAGRRYLHMATADVAAVAGQATLAFLPMLRRSPTDNAPVELAAPLIEGFVSGRDWSWTVDLAQTVGLAFTIGERE